MAVIRFTQSPSLLIWDLDGTLVSCGGRGRRAFNAAFLELYGVPSAFDHVELAGAVDGQLLHAAYQLYGIEKQDAAQFFNHYRKHLSHALLEPDALRVHPGAVEILSLTHVSHEFYNIVGTGNCAEGAEEKLRVSGLGRFFETGGYGTLPVDRWQVVQDAHRQAETLYGIEFRKDAVWVIGDTPLDIQGAALNGYRSIAVATGGYSRETLEACGPDLVLESLTETRRMLQMIQSSSAEQEEAI